MSLSNNSNNSNNSGGSVSLMEKEAREAPWIISRQLQENLTLWQALFLRLQAINPAYVVTVARGSSDHAATYGKYAIETKMGLAVASAAPSVMTLYGSHLKLKQSLVLALSQSGKSPDLCESLSSAKKSGALTVALVNQTSSPLAEMAEYVVPVWAGDELSVAATKSYLGTLSALAQFVGVCTKDQKLLAALDQLPKYLQQACQETWPEMIELLKDAKDIFIVGRGYSFPIAQEASLKCKETCGLHAEAFSSAEVRHGPFALVQKDFPVILFAQNDQSFEMTCELSKYIKSLGARSLLIINKDQASRVTPEHYTALFTVPDSLHPMLDPILMIQSFYLMVANLSKARGLNPDQPDNLKKVTETR